MLQGDLFTRRFLEEGITETEAWQNVPDSEVDRLAVRIRAVFAAFPVAGSPNEATTERDLIFKVLPLIGWEHFLTQQTTSRRGRSDVPDALMFPDAGAKAAANAEATDAARYRHGLAIIENKAWMVPLDRKSGGAYGVPSAQMLRYLSLAHGQSERRIKWGVLTNGRLWRLYFQEARSRLEEFLELDLPVIVGAEGIAPEPFAPQTDADRRHWTKLFLVLFGVSGFLPRPPAGRSFHDLALEEGHRWEAEIAQNLSGIVFSDVFPKLVNHLAAHDPQRPPGLHRAYLDDVRDSALTLLYRLLFILYAEDRNLLPVRDSKYDDYGLHKEVRESVARRMDAADTFSASIDSYYNRVKQLCRVIDGGDESIGLPAYNGGLFSSSRAPLLERVQIPDAVFAPLIDKLSRRVEADRPRLINYRDLSVQQLGSIYEGLLGYRLAADSDGRVDLAPDAFARKTTGSYYTPDDLVDLIIDRAVGPLVKQRQDAFLAKVAELKSSNRPKDERTASVRELDPATRCLDLKVCDPAMGSGHFLVSLVDYLADRIVEAMAEAETAVPWADEEHPYESPLTARIAAIRERILKEAKTHGWAVREDQLDDKHVVRRMILKRVIYGVDKNPMAVELSKLSLWLHTFTTGAPLSFLDHHLRTGDSLFGEWVRPAEDALLAEGAMMINSIVVAARRSAVGMAAVEQITDADIAEVRESAERFSSVAEATAPLRRFLDFLHGLKWLAPVDRHAVRAFLDKSFGDPIGILAGTVQPMRPAPAEQTPLFRLPEPTQQELVRLPVSDAATFDAAMELVDRVRSLAASGRFLHWEPEFPGVWSDWESAAPKGGFDAVIGNPPWDRIKLQEVEWFAARRPEIARAQRAADRRRMIAALKEAGDPLSADYEAAQDHAESAARLARMGGQYPLLSGGDINLYALFVERAHRLVRPDGMVGLLVPSGIASDKSASAFFGAVAGSGRLAALLDFENRRPPGRISSRTWTAGSSSAPTSPAGKKSASRRRTTHSSCMASRRLPSRSGPSP